MREISLPQELVRVYEVPSELKIILLDFYLLCTQLQNCVEQKIAVRVIRGHESKSSYCGKVYTYDGLYQVIF